MINEQKRMMELAGINEGKTTTPPFTNREILDAWSHLKSNWTKITKTNKSVLDKVVNGDDFEEDKGPHWNKVQKNVNKWLSKTSPELNIDDFWEELDRALFG